MYYDFLEYFVFGREYMNISENMNVHQWAQDMAEQKSSGLTRKQWCDLKGIQLSTYDYRCRKVRRILEKKMNEQQDNGTAIISPKCGQTHLGEAVFAKVNLQASQSAASGIHIRLSDAEVAIAPDAPSEHVRMVLEALAYA